VTEVAMNTVKVQIRKEHNHLPFAVFKKLNTQNSRSTCKAMHRLAGGKGIQKMEIYEI